MVIIICQNKKDHVWLNTGLGQVKKSSVDMVNFYANFVTADHNLYKFYTPKMTHDFLQFSQQIRVANRLCDK